MTSFGNYQIVRPMPGGGMTDHYVVLDGRGRRGVLRLLRKPHGNNASLRKRFRNGCELQLSLRHPNIVPAWDAGIHEDRLYSVVEYVEAPNLRKRLSTRFPLLLQQRRSLLLQMAQALAAVHQHGYLHLDVKPENYLVDDGGQVRLLDFDLAVPYTGCPLRVPRDGSTPNYTAPEVQRGKPADERADQFSFGVCAYELLTFHKPFLLDDVPVGTGDALEDRALFSMSRYTEAVPPALERTVRNCLAVDPADRYPSMDLVVRHMTLLR